MLYTTDYVVLMYVSFHLAIIHIWLLHVRILLFPQNDKHECEASWILRKDVTTYSIIIIIIIIKERFNVAFSK